LSSSHARHETAPLADSLPGLRGKFISFEGIDGCGKSTQAALVADRLARGGVPLVRTREPGGTRIGKALRELLLDPHSRGMVPECEVLLFIADRVQHLAEVIRPALQRGAVVVCDRFHDATEAFQRDGRGLDFAPLQPVLERHVQPRPDVTFWLDVEIAVALARLRKREGQGSGFANLDELTRLEQEPGTFHQRVREGYRRIAQAEPNRVERVDGTAAVEAVHADIWRRLESRYRL